MCFETKREQAVREAKEAQEREVANQVYIDPPYQPEGIPASAREGSFGEPVQIPSDENQTVEANVYTKFFPGKPEKAVNLRNNLEHSTEHVLETLRKRQNELGPELYDVYRENVNEKVEEIIDILTQADVANEDQAVIAHFLQRVTTATICESNAKELFKSLLGDFISHAGGISAVGIDELLGNGEANAVFGRNRA